MTINQCAPGYWLGRSGEGAAASFSKGKIDNFCWGGGGGIAFIFRLGGRNQMLRPVDSVENMAIKGKTEGLRLKRPGDGAATSFFEEDFGQFFWRGGGGGGYRLLFATGQAN